MRSRQQESQRFSSRFPGSNCGSSSAVNSNTHTASSDQSPARSMRIILLHVRALHRCLLQLVLQKRMMNVFKNVLDGTESRRSPGTWIKRHFGQRMTISGQPRASRGGETRFLCESPIPEEWPNVPVFTADRRHVRERRTNAPYPGGHTRRCIGSYCGRVDHRALGCSPSR